jgi:pilus assembly protein CpaB
MKGKILLILVLIMAVATTILFYDYIRKLDARYKSIENKATMLVVKVDVRKYQKISKEMLEIKEVNEEAVHPLAIGKLADAVGRYALTEINKGEPLFPNRLTNQVEESEVLGRKIREGYRAVAVEVNLVESVSNLIQPEDYIDVVFSEKLIIEGQQPIVNTNVILQKIRVLAVGKRLTEGKIQGDSGKAENEKELEYISVALELNLEDVVKLINADERGNIKLVLLSRVTP